MESTIKAIPLIMIHLLLVGCAASSGNGRMFTYVEPSFSNGNSYVTHYRVGMSRGGGVTAFLFSDNKYVTKIMYAGYHTEIVKPGSHTYKTIKHFEGLATVVPLISAIEFSIRNELAEAKTALVLDVEPNKEYFVSWRIDVNKGVLIPSVVPKEKALQELKALREFDFDGEVRKLK